MKEVFEVKLDLKNNVLKIENTKPYKLEAKNEEEAYDRLVEILEWAFKQVEMEYEVYPHEDNEFGLLYDCYVKAPKALHLKIKLSKDSVLPNLKDLKDIENLINDGSDFIQYVNVSRYAVEETEDYDIDIREVCGSEAELELERLEIIYDKNCFLFDFLILVNF